MELLAVSLTTALSWGVAGALLLYFVFWTIKAAEDPALRLFKWILTAPIVLYMVFKVAPAMEKGGIGAAFMVPVSAFCGLFLVVIWRKDIAAAIARPFENLYTGGSVPPEPKPFYSVALARQKQGHYSEAIAEVRRQLERFPDDFEGRMLLAQIQAEDLKDLQAAELTIQEFCSQPGHSAGHLVFALYSMADWHLRYSQDRDAARRALEKVIELLPDSEFALGAAQRIAHLATSEMLLSPHERKKFSVAVGIQNLGLLKAGHGPQIAPETSPEDAACQYVEHLKTHPLDTEAREKLAVIYADHYGRLDLATDQLNELIECPNQPAKLIVRWLNLLADLQIRGGAQPLEIRATLQQIIDRWPNFSAAASAQKRLDLLNLELKGREKKQAIKLGSYEQNLGLKN